MWLSRTLTSGDADNMDGVHIKWEDLRRSCTSPSKISCDGKTFGVGRACIEAAPIIRYGESTPDGGSVLDHPDVGTSLGFILARHVFF